MKLNAKFLTHTTNGEHYMISTSDTDFKGIIKNNETAAYIIESLKFETTENNIVEKIMNEYNVDDRSIVVRDVEDTIKKLRSIGAIEE